MAEWYQYKVTRGFMWEWIRSFWHNHSGIDYGAPCGTPIASPVDGTVIGAGTKPWGGQVDIKVDGLQGYIKGPHVLTFLHTSAQYVGVGQKVTSGQVLGLSGQPPPGQGYGSGCHVHFEVTYGETAPYTSNYSPSRNPDVNHFPESPGPFVDALQSGKHGGYQDTQPVDDCGPLPHREDYADDATFAAAIKKWEDCKLAEVEKATSGNPLQQIADSLGGIGSAFGNVASWISTRGFKLLMGASLCFGALVLAFLPDIGAAVATAAGFPEFAGNIRQASRGPRGFVSGAIGAAGKVPGRQRAIERARERERVAAWHGYFRQQKEEKSYAAAREAAQERMARKTKPLQKVISVEQASEDIPPGTKARNAKRQTSKYAHGAMPTARRAFVASTPPTQRRSFAGSLGMTPGNIKEGRGAHAQAARLASHETRPSERKKSRLERLRRPGSLKVERERATLAGEKPTPRPDMTKIGKAVRRARQRLIARQAAKIKAKE